METRTSLQRNLLSLRSDPATIDERVKQSRATLLKYAGILAYATRQDLTFHTGPAIAGE